MKIISGVAKLLHTGWNPVATNSSTVSSLCGMSTCHSLQRLLQLIKSSVNLPIISTKMGWFVVGFVFFPVPQPEELSICLK